MESSPTFPALQNDLTSQEGQPVNIINKKRPHFNLLQFGSTKDIVARFLEKTGRDATSAIDEYEEAYSANL